MKVAPAFALIVLCTAAVAAQEPEEDHHAHPPYERSAFETLEDFGLEHNVTKENLGHHLGECAVGATCGAIAGWVMRRLQGAAMTASVVASIGAAAGLHLDWISPEQLQLLLVAGWRLMKSQVRKLLMIADVDEDGELTMEDSKLAYSRVAPHARRHPALAAGLATGFIAAYGAK